MLNFPLISADKKYIFFFKLLLLIALVVLRSLDSIKAYLPIEIWNVVMMFLAVSVVFNLVRFITITAYRTRNKLEAGQRDNFVLGVDSLTRLAVFIVVVAAALFIFGIAFQTVITSISLVAVALVLIFRDYISNYLDSFRLMFSTDYQLDDYIRVGESTKGIISDINFRATKLKTDEGDVLFIPNTKLMTSEVVNYSKTKFKRIIVPFSLPTEGVRSIVDFEDRIEEVVLAAFPDLVQKHKMFLRINNIEDWQTNFSFEVSVDHYNFTIEEQIIRVVYQAVLSQEGVVQAPTTVLLQAKKTTAKAV
jgi:small-conductance mechanosensitive channel